MTLLSAAQTRLSSARKNATHNLVPKVPPPIFASKVNPSFLLDTIIPTDVTKSVDESESKEFTTSVDIESTPSDKEKPDEYEIVESDECDDGEWVEQEAEPAALKVSAPAALKARAPAALKEATKALVPTSVTIFAYS